MLAIQSYIQEMFTCANEFSLLVVGSTDSEVEWGALLKNCSLARIRYSKLNLFVHFRCFAVLCILFWFWFTTVANLQCCIVRAKLYESNKLMVKFDNFLKSYSNLDVDVGTFQESVWIHGPVLLFAQCYVATVLKARRGCIAASVLQGRWYFGNFLGQIVDSTQCLIVIVDGYHEILVGNQILQALRVLANDCKLDISLHIQQVSHQVCVLQILNFICRNCRN